MRGDLKKTLESETRVATVSTRAFARASNPHESVSLRSRAENARLSVHAYRGAVRTRNSSAQTAQHRSYDRSHEEFGLFLRRNIDTQPRLTVSPEFVRGKIVDVDEFHHLSVIGA